MNQQNVVEIYNGVLFSLRKEGNSDSAATWIKLGDIMLSDYPITRSQIP
jgi:hypothetical protein